MANDKRLNISFQAENKQLKRVIADTEKRLKSTEKQLGQAVNKINTGFSKAGKGVTNFSRAANDANGGIKSMRGSLGQLGFQVQDIAVQLQSGQNAMLVFGQQGSQIASIFGPTGAIVGALLAVGAALGTAFLPRLFESTDALEKLEAAFASVDKIIKETKGNLIIITDEFAKLSSEANKLSEARLKIALGDISDALKEAKDETIGLAKAMSPSELGGRFNRTFSFFQIMTRDLESGKISLADYAKQVSKLFVGDPESSREFRDTLKEVLDLTEKSNKLMESQRQLQEGMGGAVSESRAKEIEKEAEALEKFTQTTADFANSRTFSLEDRVFAIQDSMRTQTEIIQDSFNERIALLKAYKRRYIDEVETANELEKQLEIQKNEELKQVMLSSAQGVLSSFGQMTSQIERMTKEGSKAQKAFFLVNQAIAAASAIIKGLQAAMATRLAFAEMAALTANPALIGAGEAMAKAQMVMGFATAGMIAGQTIASFEGGGFTPSGPRSGGMDGKGGMLAMVHPNEKITDMTKGQDGPSIQIINNVSNAKPSAQMDRDGVVRIIIDEISNQNSRTRSALHQTSNVLPRGRN